MKSAEEFKEESIALLTYCLNETKRVAKEDNLDSDEEKANTENYCEGLNDAIEKIKGLSIE